MYKIVDPIVAGKWIFQLCRYVWVKDPIWIGIRHDGNIKNKWKWFTIYWTFIRDWEYGRTGRNSAIFKFVFVQFSLVCRVRIWNSASASSRFCIFIFIFLCWYRNVFVMYIVSFFDKYMLDYLRMDLLM